LWISFTSAGNGGGGGGATVAGGNALVQLQVLDLQVQEEMEQQVQSMEHLLQEQVVVAGGRWRLWYCRCSRNRWWRNWWIKHLLIQQQAGSTNTGGGGGGGADDAGQGGAGGSGICC
jgi:hypothetical protein